MRIGIKLDPDYRQHKFYRELYGRHELLPFLRELGLTAVEIPIGVETDDSHVLELVKRCRDVGLFVSFHPYTEKTPNNPAHFAPDSANPCRLLHERFLRLAGRASEMQHDGVIINIHPATDTRCASRRKLVEQSIQFFRWARQWCGENAPFVQPLAELQIRADLEEYIQRIGDTYAELIEILERSQVGGTWDFGHAVMNTKRFGDDVNPPDSLVRQIAHVHCHDVNETDHQPLVFGHVPWQRFLNDLKVVGFDGTVVLEVRPEEFLAAGGVQTLIHSVHLIAEHVKQ